MEKCDFSTLDISVIDSVLSSKHLAIESEHCLFEFINELSPEHGDE